MSNNTEDLIDRVAALGSLLKDATPVADQERRLPQNLLDALHANKLFRLLLPQSYGGGEISPPDFFRIIESIARFDASTAWCLCQANGCAMAAAYLPAASAEIIWGDPQAVLAWGPGAGTTLTTDGAGYRVDGEWSFASGCRHANWLGAQAVICSNDGTPSLDKQGNRLIRTALIPANQATLIDNWQVLGLRGTGSFGFRVTDQWVDADFCVARDDPAERRCNTPLYQFPLISLYASGFSATALGVAASMLNAFKMLAADKTPRLARQRLQDNAMVQSEVGIATAQLSAARCFVLAELEDIWQDVSACNTLSIDQRVRIRLATTHAIHEAKQVADRVYDAAGATAVFSGNGFEQGFRDIHAITQQIQGRKSHYQTAGAYLLGHDADLSVI